MVVAGVVTAEGWEARVYQVPLYEYDKGVWGGHELCTRMLWKEGSMGFCRAEITARHNIVD